MFVYAHWTTEGHHTLQAFHKIEKATAFAFNQIQAYLYNEESNYAISKSIQPTELSIVKNKLAEIQKNQTIENVQELILLYEDYCRVIGRSSPLHIVKAIQVVE